MLACSAGGLAGHPLAGRQLAGRWLRQLAGQPGGFLARVSSSYGPEGKEFVGTAGDSDELL